MMHEIMFRYVLRNQVVLITLAIAIASGQFRFIVPVGFFYLALFFSQRLTKPPMILYFLVAFCLLFLVFFNRPSSQDYGYLTPLWVLGLSLSVLISFMFGYGSKSFQEAEIRFFWVVMVAFCYGAITIVATVLLMDFPYYGQVFDIFKWGGSASGARVSTLMLLTPIFLCGFLGVPKKTGRFFYVVITMSLASVFMGFVLEKRIHFIVVFLVLPILFFLFNRGAILKKLTVVIFSFSCFSLAAWVLRDQLVDRFYLEYSRNGGRLWLYESFFRQLSNGDLTQIVTPISMTDAPLWFHNLFMDVYRISGPWATLSLICLFGVFASRLHALGRTQVLAASCIACWFLPLFIIANVSVVPEGEPQFLLLMVFLMGVTERMLRSSNLGHSGSV